MAEQETVVELKHLLNQWANDEDMHSPFMKYEVDQKFINAVYLAKNALEKQIAKKPRFYAHNYYCEECGNLVGNNEFEWQRFLYCDKCGQKLDWSEV